MDDTSMWVGPVLKHMRVRQPKALLHNNERKKAFVVLYIFQFFFRQFDKKEEI